MLICFWFVDVNQSIEFAGRLTPFCAESDSMTASVWLLRSAASHHALIVSGDVFKELSFRLAAASSGL